LSPDLIAVLIVMIVLIFYQFGLRHVLTYRLTDTDVRAVLFGAVPVSVRRYRFITEVHATSPLGSPFSLALRAQNRFIGQGVMVSSSGSFFPVLYTPDDAEGFARELRRRVYRQTGRVPLGS
jgi:hypothetical protein